VGSVADVSEVHTASIYVVEGYIYVSGPSETRKKYVMGPAGPKTKYDSADEGQQ
jgi:tartrate dehydratase beta subunit/fumarate hydratase class I family protein